MGHVQVAKALLDAGASAEIADHEGNHGEELVRVMRWAALALGSSPANGRTVKHGMLWWGAI